MNRGSARRKIFLDREDYEAFLHTLAEAQPVWGVEVFAYCLMDNHYHLCLRTPEGNLSRIMRHLNGLYTQRFNRIHGRDGALFRGRYKAILIDAGEYLTSVVRYIHLNPVQAKSVKSPEAYAWSSHGAYVGKRKAPKWLNMSEVLGYFTTVRDFHKFVLSESEDVVKDFYGRSRQGPVLGGERFIEQIRSRVGNVTREHPRHDRVMIRPSVDRVVGLVAQGYGTEGEDVVQGRRGTGNEARKVAMYLVKRLCGLTLQETAKQFGVGSYGVVGWACHAIRTKMESDKGFKVKIKKIEGLSTKDLTLKEREVL